MLVKKISYTDLDGNEREETFLFDGYEREHQMFVRLDLRNADRMALDVGGFFDRHPVGRKVAGLKPTPGPEPLDLESGSVEITLPDESSPSAD